MLTFGQALRLYPASFFWAIAISFTIIMEGYDTYLIGNSYAYPSFAKKYRQYQADSGTWAIPAMWQVALSDLGNIGNVVGLLLMGVLTDGFGHRLVIMAGLIVMVGLNVMTFFAPNVQVLTAAMALGGIPTGVFGIMGLAYASEVLEALVGNPTEWSFRNPFAIEWAWPVPIFVLAIFAPDWPWWCVRRDNLAGAERSLTRLSSGSTPTEIRQTLAMMFHTDKLEKAVKTEVSLWDCFKGTNLRRTEIACMVLAAQALSSESFAYGSTYFFTQAGLISADSPQAQLWRQRRCIRGHLRLGPQSFGLAAEVSATRLRSQTISPARLTYQLASLVTNTVEPYLINPTAADLKGKTAFVWFAISVLTIAWCAFRMPETKGITYTEMDILFEKRTPAWRFTQAKVDVVDEGHHGAA
ncbi:hypothetical protein JCM24511_10040 [Saitozyma sp. JCM 24511]|nr:hypothetical protein JCM24511_10040 [Saitozyma sp. JCM 24511]